MSGYQDEDLNPVFGQKFYDKKSCSVACKAFCSVYFPK